MEETQKDYLLALLNLATKIQNRDTTISGDITTLNNQILSDDEVNQIDEILDEQAEAITSTSKDFFANIIDGLNCITEKDYFKEMVNIRIAIDTSPKKDIALQGFLVRLNNIVIKDFTKQFRFYSLLTRLAISSHRVDLIQQMITKIQSL